MEVNTSGESSMIQNPKNNFDFVGEKGRPDVRLIGFSFLVLNGLSFSKNIIGTISIEMDIATEPLNRGVFDVLSKEEGVVSSGLDYILGRLIREPTEIPAPINEVYL